MGTAGKPLPLGWAKSDAKDAAARARARAYKDAAYMVRRWSLGYSTRLQEDMDMLARQMEAKAELNHQAPNREGR